MVRSSSDFFVAGRSLGPGLIFSSMLAANIGAGATVGAAGLGYRDGLSAWWWSGSAGIGSLVLAFWVGPRMWALAKTHGFYTTGDFLEYRYGPAVRGIITVLVTFGCLWILAAQLMAGAAILNVITGAPRWVGSLIGGAIMTVYFTAGGPARHRVGEHAAAGRDAGRVRCRAAVRARQRRRPGSVRVAPACRRASPTSPTRRGRARAGRSWRSPARRSSSRRD